MKTEFSLQIIWPVPGITSPSRGDSPPCVCILASTWNWFIFYPFTREQLSLNWSYPKVIRLLSHSRFYWGLNPSLREELHITGGSCHSSHTEKNELRCPVRTQSSWYFAFFLKTAHQGLSTFLRFYRWWIWGSSGRKGLDLRVRAGTVTAGSRIWDWLHYITLISVIH